MLVVIFLLAFYFISISLDNLFELRKHTLISFFFVLSTLLFSVIVLIDNKVGVFKGFKNFFANNSSGDSTGGHDTSGDSGGGSSE